MSGMYSLKRMGIQPILTIQPKASVADYATEVRPCHSNSQIFGIEKAYDLEAMLFLPTKVTGHLKLTAYNP